MWLHADGSYDISRPIHPLERFAVQGMRPAFAARPTKKAGREITYMIGLNARLRH